MKYLGMVKIIETESKMMVVRGWGEEVMGNYCLLAIVSVLRVTEIDCSDGCTTF